MKTPPTMSPAVRPTKRRTVAEIAGETAAECAAVCCCCPCGLLGLVICAIVKLPAGLCRRMYLKRRRRRRLRMRSAVEASLWGSKPAAVGPCCGDDGDDVAMEWGMPAASKSPEMAEMEREMMERFYATGFWRSPSQREDR